MWGFVHIAKRLDSTLLRSFTTLGLAGTPLIPIRHWQDVPHATVPCLAWGR